MILEAMAAGIPVIASDLAAHRDVVIHGKTGWIVTAQEDLKQAIEFTKHTGKQQAHGGRGKKLDKRAYRNLGGLRPDAMKPPMRR